MLGFFSPTTSSISIDVVTNLFKFEDCTKGKCTDMQLTETGISSRRCFKAFIFLLKEFFRLDLQWFWDLMRRIKRLSEGVELDSVTTMKETCLRWVWKHSFIYTRSCEIQISLSSFTLIYFISRRWRKKDQVTLGPLNGECVAMVEEGWGCRREWALHDTDLEYRQTDVCMQVECVCDVCIHIYVNIRYKFDLIMQ